jgi:hypothetical protein
MAIRSQHVNDPRINDRSIGNPVIMFAFKLLVFITVFYIGSFYVISYQWFNYYMIPFYLFPLPQIWHTAKTGTRNCWKWYFLKSPMKPRQYQLLLWPSSLIIPIFTKGYDGNFLKLTPCVLLSIVLPSLIAVQVIFSVLMVKDSVLVPAKCLRGKIFCDETVLPCAAQIHRKFERSAGGAGRARRVR